MSTLGSLAANLVALLQRGKRSASGRARIFVLVLAALRARVQGWGGHTLGLAFTVNTKLTGRCTSLNGCGLTLFRAGRRRHVLAFLAGLAHDEGLTASIALLGGQHGTRGLAAGPPGANVGGAMLGTIRILGALASFRANGHTIRGIVTLLGTRALHAGLATVGANMRWVPIARSNALVRVGICALLCALALMDILALAQGLAVAHLGDDTLALAIQLDGRRCCGRRRCHIKLVGRRCGGRGRNRCGGRGSGRRCGRRSGCCCCRGGGGLRRAGGSLGARDALTTLLATHTPATMLGVLHATLFNTLGLGTTLGTLAVHLAQTT